MFGDRRVASACLSFLRVLQRLAPMGWHFAHEVIYNAFPYQGALRQDLHLARLDTVTKQLRSRYFFSDFLKGGREQRRSHDYQFQ
jgi:hypothetical protein